MNQTEFRAATVRAGESNASLAAKIGISVQAMYNKVHGKAEFKASEIKKLAKILNLSMGDVNTIFFVGDVNLIHESGPTTIQ